MSPNRHSIAAVSTARKFKTPLKASVILLTSMILAACNTTDEPSYNLNDVFNKPTLTEKQLEEAKAEAEAEKLKAEKALEDKAKAEAALAAAEKAALEAKKESDAAIAAAEKAKKEAEDALEDTLANGGGGNKEELQKIADEKAKLAEEAQATAAAAQTTANAAQQVAKDAAAAAVIKNTAQANKSGVQSLNVNAGPLGSFVTTTDDFSINEDGSVLDARADIASVTTPGEPGLLPIVPVTISGTNDTDVQAGFKAYKGNAGIKTSLGELPLNYTSTYKDFGDDMRIGHIDGAAALGANQLPVNGVAVVGNATEAANVPTEGTVGYTGDATYRKLGIGNAIEFGTSVFTADFVAKNVKGDLTFTDKKIGLEATIAGNQFSGSKDGYKADGGFFGGDAQYLGGVYEGNGAQGTYGAKSNKQTQADKAAGEAAKKSAVAKKALDDAQAAAAKAKKDAERAQAAVDNAGNSGDGQALQDALEKLAAAEQAAEQAKQEAQIAIQKAADKAKEEVEAATAALVIAQAEKQAADQAALKAKNDADTAIGEAKTEAANEVTAAKEKLEAAKLAEQKALVEKTAAEQKAQDLKVQLDALKTGVQHLSVDASALTQGVKTTTTRDFAIRSSSDVDARADFALDILPKPITIQVSGDNDAETKNGFKAYQGTGNVTGEDDLSYTATYKDFGNGIMRIAHIDGAAANGAVPVDGVAVVGNKTATLPTEGTFEYAGDATNRKVGVDNAIEYGSSKLTADFVASKVDGTLKFAQAGEIGLSADINGNEFSGAAVNNTGYNTEGAFYGKDANFIGGIYEGNGSQGTFGAEKQKQQDPNPETPVNPDIKPADTNMTGFQSTAMSSLKANSSAFKKFEDAIGYVAIRDDASDFTETETQNGSEVPKDNRKGNNFTSFDKGVVRGDMVQPASVKAPIAVNLTTTKAATVKVDAGLAGANPDFKYNAVYEKFGEQMQVGHVYGVLNSSLLGKDVSRVANVYVQGHLTNQADIDFLKGVNEGKVTYEGNATYMENIHLGDIGAFEPVDGSSVFDVDFVNNSVKGELSFEGDFKRNPTGKIAINATIDGNTFAGNQNGIDTAGGFYGQDAQFLGGIYQDASGTSGGKGTGPGTGTKFQGTFGAEKQ